MHLSSGHMFSQTVLSNHSHNKRKDSLETQGPHLAEF